MKKKDFSPNYTSVKNQILVNITLESKRQTSAQFTLEQKNVNFSPIYTGVNKLDIGPDYYTKVKMVEITPIYTSEKKVDQICLAYI